MKDIRIKILELIIIILMSILIINLFCIQIIKKEYYQNKLDKMVGNIKEGETAPRGYIYDRNHKLLVNNKAIKEIYYVKKNITREEEIKLSYEIADIIDIDYSKINDYDLKKFWIKKDIDKSNKLITKEEYKKLDERKLTSSDIENLKLERIDISDMNENDKEAAEIYYLMNKGYSYQEKTIKKDCTEDEYQKIALNNYKGFGVKINWERNYIYGDTFKSILGNISSENGIPNDLKDYYLEKGYNLNDRVGISYLEYQYDDYLKGTKSKYKLNKYNELELKEEGSIGSSIVLTIDIDLQSSIEEILKEEILKAKEEPNTSFYNKSFVIISNPKTGEILAMSGKQAVLKNDKYEIIDYTPGVLTLPIVPGSIIKGASHIVGYNTGTLKIDEQRYDKCVKLKGAPQKCSWTSLGLLDDLTALKYSSNTYQFYTALKVANTEYYYDMPFSPTLETFEIYRNTFKEFGLGVKTEIDLPIESIGYLGSETKGGLLLDFSIGQYDNYTPIQINQYMSTIANDGIRLKPYLLKEVYSDIELKNKIYENNKTELNKVNTKKEYLDRVKEGFKMVLEYGGTGSGYINQEYKPAGKTGTSQSFVDSNSDGIVDTETITNTFSGYLPYDDPEVVFTVISPDIYYSSNNSTYQTSVNKRISKRISEKYFEIFK